METIKRRASLLILLLLLALCVVVGASLYGNQRALSQPTRSAGQTVRSAATSPTPAYLYYVLKASMPAANLVDAAPTPDGRHIIYSTSSGLSLGSDTWLANSNGSARRHLFKQSGTQAIDALFAWSPYLSTCYAVW